ncbi:hypothetical protein BDB00DRAFT_871171 [Zychaea mexicana]|uniref:uncharacterized protein n=1 Tax=Zychaea mexicana TaxID=64656 RepID=UPI0022FEC6DD|nr:uncharacterized protein BDB00DRAFT_871171 [Zychaea mexicana]KAI9494617.1 hypothetical protein BDB00DRAFT_871171 [Zychaea mexicana]
MDAFLDDLHGKYKEDFNQGSPMVDQHQILGIESNSVQRTTSASSAALSTQRSTPSLTVSNSPTPYNESEGATTATISGGGGGAEECGSNSHMLNESSNRRQRMLEKNRRAAARCRQRKKIWTEELAQQHQEAKRRNDELQGLVPQLREEVYSLKNQLLAHEGCDCHAVRNYIKVFLMNDVVQKSKMSDSSLRSAPPDQPFS